MTSKLLSLLCCLLSFSGTIVKTVEASDVNASTESCFNGFELRIFSAPWCAPCATLKQSLKNDGRLNGERGSFSVYSSGKEIKIPIRIVTLEDQTPDEKAWDKLRSQGLITGMLPEIVLLKDGTPYANPLTYKSTLSAIDAAKKDPRPEVKKDPARTGIAWGYRSMFLDPVLIESFSEPKLIGTPKDPLKSQAIQKKVSAECRNEFSKLTTLAAASKAHAEIHNAIKNTPTAPLDPPAAAPR